MAVHAPSLATVLRDPKTIGSAPGAAADLILGGAARDAIQVFLGKLDVLIPDKGQQFFCGIASACLGPLLVCQIVESPGCPSFYVAWPTITTPSFTPTS